jgi:hypothetical protein
MPHYFVEKESKGNSGGHWSHNVLLTLTSQLGYSYKEAINLPFSQALYDYLKNAEGMGIVRLFSTEDEVWLAEEEARKGKAAQ